MKHLLVNLRRRRAEKLSRGQLVRFDHETLADLGIARSDIHRLVRNLT
ncbi:MAG: DUF1127 domain-containing protein [Alphaproteobacteria bacterium]